MREGVEILPDGTIVSVTYGKWDSSTPNYIMAVRFKPPICSSHSGNPLKFDTLRQRHLPVRLPLWT